MQKAIWTVLHHYLKPSIAVTHTSDEPIVHPEQRVSVPEDEDNVLQTKY